MLSSQGGKSFFPPELHLYVSLDTYSLHHYHCILIPCILSFLLHFSCSSHILAGVPTARISWAWGSYWDKGSLVLFFLFHWLSEIQGLYLMNWFLPWSIWIRFWIPLPLLMFNSFIIKCKGDPNWKMLTINYITLILFQQKIEESLLPSLFIKTIRGLELYLVVLLLKSIF